MKTYTELKTAHRKEMDNFKGIFFAFNDKQLKEGLQGLNCTTKDIARLRSGGYILKTRVKDFIGIIERHDDESKALRKARKALKHANK